MEPLVFEPLLKRIRWGGRRLGTVLGKPIGAESDYAESWEVSDHGDDQSIVVSGNFAGQTLSQLVNTQNVPLLGRHTGAKQFPLLVKYLDANEALSVQVHPDDKLAKQFDPSENGKTEAWVIIDSAPDSVLYVGFEEGVSETDIRAAADQGDVEPLLHRVQVQSGDCVFVPAGTVHAIGAGVLLAEIQQSSDITFRLNDWNRVGPDGQPRDLHIKEAIRCIDIDRGPVNPVQPRRIDADHTWEELVRCPYFVMQRHRSDRSFTMQADNACHVLMVLSGSGRLLTEQGQTPLPLGQTVLLPAERTDVRIEPNGELAVLDAFLPASQL